MQPIVVAIVAVAVALATLQTHATPVQPHLADPTHDTDPTPFTASVLALQQRLLNVTHYTDAWLRRQRNRADSFVTIIARVPLAAVANSVQLVTTLRQQSVDTLRLDCDAIGDNEAERSQRIDWLHANATQMGDVLAGCAALAHDDLNRVVKEKFYTYYRDLQTQSLSAKSSVFMGFQLYNPSTQQTRIVQLLEEIVEQVDRSFVVYLKPEVEAEIGLVAERGQLIVGMATACAYDVATYYSELVHDMVAVC